MAGIAQRQSNCLVNSRSLVQFQLSALIKQIKMVNKNGINNSETQSKIIRISLLTPKLGGGLESINQLKKSELAWTTDLKTIKSNDDSFEMIYENDVLDPWKLILKK